MLSRDIFAGRLKEQRKKKGLTQGEVARVMGMSATQISDMEKGRRTTTLEKFVLFCEFYQVSADYLLGLKDGLEEVPGEQP